MAGSPLERTDAEAIALTLDDLAREGARRMIATALRAEVDEYASRFAEEVDEDGRDAGWWSGTVERASAG